MYCLGFVETDGYTLPIWPPFFNAAGLCSTTKRKKFHSVHVVTKESGFSSDLINNISEPRQCETSKCIDVGHSVGLYGKERFAQSVVSHTIA